jgi:hypothetical protein
MFRFPSPSLVVSITALIVALGGASYSATGGNFILGRSNSASTQTKLVAGVAGPALGVDNLNTGAGAAGLRIVTAATRPPLIVNSSTRVDNLNADKLDGLNSTQFARKLVIPFNLAPDAISTQIPVPADQPVFVMGVTSTTMVHGVGQVTLLRGLNTALWWVGLESTSGSAITQGATSAAGTHIVYIDYEHEVDIEVGGPNTIRVHNGSFFTKSGIVTLIW